MGVCKICNDDHPDDLPFTCPSPRCSYELCSACVKFAFEDASGENAKCCPECKDEIAVKMIESVLGTGAVRVVEAELRDRVVFEVRKERSIIEKGKDAMKGMKARARELYNVLAEEVTSCTKCPRCQTVFDDYDGCNALSCRKNDCNAAICALCLKDCGTDAHSHVRISHGDLFDKRAYYMAKSQREHETINSFLASLSSEPFEVKDFIKIECEKTWSSTASSRTNSTMSGTGFVALAKRLLNVAMKNDRLSILSDGRASMIRRLTAEDISPRHLIPEDYKLHMVSDGPVCGIFLQRHNHGIWERISLPGEESSSKKKKEHEDIPDILQNIRQTLRCGVVAFEGVNRLYQTKVVPPGKGKRLDDHQISVKFQPISLDGDLVEEASFLLEIGCHGRKVIGMNQNCRLVLMERHFESSDATDLVFQPLSEYIGERPSIRFFPDIDEPPPQTFDELNEQQKKVAHPVSMKTAMEVAGPPGKIASKRAS